MRLLFPLLSLTCLTTGLAEPFSGQCPDGWVMGPEGMGCVILVVWFYHIYMGQCIVQAGALNWLEAYLYCGIQGGHLVEIKSLLQQRFLE